MSYTGLGFSVEGSLSIGGGGASASGSSSGGTSSKSATAPVNSNALLAQAQAAAAQVQAAMKSAADKAAADKAAASVGANIIFPTSMFAKPAPVFTRQMSTAQFPLTPPPEKSNIALYLVGGLAIAAAGFGLYLHSHRKMAAAH